MKSTFGSLLFAFVTVVPAMAIDKPNIILMLSDDQGWSGLSVAMHPDVPGSRGEIYHTPNLEKLAAQGMRFSSAYAPAPVCSPTRISLQTGKSPAQLHWTKAAPPEEGRRLLEPRLVKSIPDDEITIGELLQRAGYATAHYGKWHLGGGGPGRHGYDEHDGDTGNENAFKFVDPNPVDIFGMAERAEKFMAAALAAKKPFFIQLSWNALHAAENANKATLAKYKHLASGDDDRRAATAAITEDLDSGVGKIMESVARLDLSDTTYVIYMSDNGAGGGSRGGGLNGGKGSVWEGGIRVPLIIRGPDIPPNAWCHTPVVGYDFLPTFVELAGLPSSMLPPGVEGGSMVRLLQHQGKGSIIRPREELVFHFPHYQSDDGPHSAIRLGSYKLIYFYETDRVSLFDLSKDIGERHDLSSDMPKEAQQLRERLDGYLRTVHAQLPTPNPQYDPNVSPTTKRRGGKGKGSPRGAKRGDRK